MESRDAKKPSLPTTILCIYAQRDEPYYRELQTHLSIWQREGHIRWLEVRVGDPVEQTTQTHLQTANLILLLISPSFFANDLCYTSMKQSLQQNSSRQVPVIPILARDSAWEESACGGLKALPDNEQPIDLWPHPEQAYENIRLGLTRFIPTLPSTIPTLPSRPRLFQARTLPKTYIPRPTPFDAIKRNLLAQHQGQTTAITTALRGAGGFGKTTLALALCHDPEIQAAFPDGILWIELGEQPPRPLDLLNSLLVSLEKAHNGAITLREARERWQTALQDRTFLIVIDDVWQTSSLAPLLEGGPRCIRLVTTRDDHVLPEDSARIWVDAMDPLEAIALLCEGLPAEIHQPTHRPLVEAIVKRLNYWPLLLTLARGTLLSRINHGQSIERALQTLEQAYQDRGVLAFDLNNENERERAAGACLEVSLLQLEAHASPGYSPLERYQELAIFPEDTDIPLATLCQFWKGTGNLESWETDDLCIRLHQLSLLLNCNLGTGTIRLHDIMRSYLVQRAGPQLPHLHARFLDAIQRVLHLKDWTALPTDALYLWQHLVLHLGQAERQETLLTTLTDLRYLTHKALYAGVSALESDLLLASTFPSPANPTENVPSIFPSLHRTIVRLSHLLRQPHTLPEMGGLLLSHLGWQPPFVDQRPSFERTLPHPFLTAQHPLPDRASPALLRTLSGHMGVVMECAVSGDGEVIVSASEDKTLKVWDGRTGAERLTLRGHMGVVWGCAVSGDGGVIVSASEDKTLKVWDGRTGAERLTLRGHKGVVRGCAMSGDGGVIVSASEDKTLKVWDGRTGAKRLTLCGHMGVVRGCAVSGDGRVIVSASTDGTLKVWDGRTGAKRLTLSGHMGVVRGCAMSGDGAVIVSTSSDGTLKVWDGRTGAERVVTLSGHTAGVRGCAVSGDGGVIVSASEDKTLKVWDGRIGAKRVTLRGHKGEVNGCAMSGDGGVIVSASSDGTLKVWDGRTGAERLTLSGHSFSGHVAEVNGCAVSGDGGVIVSASADKTLKVWDGRTGAKRVTLREHTGRVNGCAMSGDGGVIVSASEDKTLKVWDGRTGAERVTLSGHTDRVMGCAMSGDGRVIVSASADKTLKVWDGRTGAERLTLRGHTGVVRGCAMSGDGAVIVSASNDKTLKMWDGYTGHCLLTFPVDGALYDCALYSDGQHLVACGDQGVYFFRFVF